MTMTFTEEQQVLRDTVRSFLERRSTEDDVRSLMDSELGYDPEVHKRMAGELGLQGLAVPEAHGGAGYGWVELLIVFEEMGRALLCAPYLATVGLAVPAVLAADDGSAARDLLPAWADGGRIATLAIPASAVEDGASSLELRGEVTQDGYRVSGTVEHVLDGHVADDLLIIADTDEGPTLLHVVGDAEGLARTQTPTLDQTRRQARLELTDVAARTVGAPGEGQRVLDAALDRAAVALAVEQVGGAQACLDMSVDYARTREQFDRPIGSFQAVKHKCAEVLLAVESARAASYYAGWAAADDSSELPAVASLALAFASEAYHRAAAENVQIHGGIGYTWEHPAHLYLKRAKSSELLLGTPARHREQLLQRIGV